MRVQDFDYEIPSFVGLEPNSPEFLRRMHQTFTVLSSTADAKELKAKAIELYGPLIGKEADRLPDWKFVTVGKIAFLAERASTLPAATREYLVKELTKLEQECLKLPPATVVTEKPRLTSEQKNLALFRKLKSEIEDVMDAGHNPEERKVGTLVKLRGANGPVIRMLINHFNMVLKELRNARSEEFAEAFEFVSDESIKKEIETTIAVMDEIDGGVANARNERQNSKGFKGRKGRSIERATRSTQFKSADQELGVTGLTPPQVFGQTMALVYNTKSKRMVVYRAEEGKTLEVRGTTMINFDPAKSTCKTLRRPEHDVKLFRDATNDRRVDVMFENIRGKSYEVRPRLTEDCLILKVFK